MTADKRTPVPLSDDERAVIAAAMSQEGIRSLADGLRIFALRGARAARKEGGE